MSKLPRTNTEPIFSTLVKQFAALGFPDVVLIAAPEGGNFGFMLPSEGVSLERAQVLTEQVSNTILDKKLADENSPLNKWRAMRSAYVADRRRRNRIG
jgi:hypothetical protein